jgi:hypothetical protein
MGNSNKEMGLPDFDETVTDANELSPVGREGMSLGATARPTPVDMGKSFPDLYDRPVVEYVPPSSNLPMQVSQQESAKKNREFWSTGPADSEAEAPMLAGTKVVEQRRGGQ